MLSVTNKPIMPSVVMLNVIMQSVMILSVAAPYPLCSIGKFNEIS